MCELERLLGIFREDKINFVIIDRCRNLSASIDNHYFATCRRHADDPQIYEAHFSVAT